jgi:hypothetical protein
MSLAHPLSNHKLICQIKGEWVSMFTSLAISQPRFERTGKNPAAVAGVDNFLCDQEPSENISLHLYN